MQFFLYFCSRFCPQYMNRSLLHILIISLFLSLQSIAVSADTVHNIHKMSSEGTLVNEGTTTRSTEDGIVYTRYGVDVGWDVDHPGGGVGALVCFNLFDTNDSIKTSPKIKSLHSVVISHIPKSQCEKIKVQFSEDGTDWTTIVPTVTYSNGYITALAPSDGDYFVKIRSINGGTDVSITQINYTFGDCNCFTYTE